MLEDSLTIRNEMMSARQRWRILLDSLPESFVLARIVVVPRAMRAFVASVGMKHASGGGGAW